MENNTTEQKKENPCQMALKFFEQNQKIKELPFISAHSTLDMIQARANQMQFLSEGCKAYEASKRLEKHEKIEHAEDTDVSFDFRT